MEHQQQGINECLPTSIAILAGRTKNEVIAWGLNYYANEFGIVASNWNTLHWKRLGSSRWWQCAIALMNHFLGETAGQAHYGGVYKSRISGYPILTAGADATRIRQPRVLPKGRGLITIRRYRQQHAVAFADGFVYDPSAPAPLLYREWRTTQAKGWRIIAVQILKNQEGK